MQQRRTDASAMTFDVASMERSKGFVKALQELKNLRPQLYSAADYCEKSYLHNEQKQIVLDNLKDYAVRALVNAVDHLGTVAFKLNDLFDQQASEMGMVEIKISSLNQRVLSSQCYIDKDNLRERQLFPVCARLQKRYILPSTVQLLVFVLFFSLSKISSSSSVPDSGKSSASDNQGSVELIPPLTTRTAAVGNPPSLSNGKQSPVQSRPPPNSLHSVKKADANGNQSPSQSMPGTKTLLWHLASESNGASKTPGGNDNTNESKNSDLPLSAAHKAGSGTPATDPAIRSLLVMDAGEEVYGPSIFRKENGSAARDEIIRAPLRSKSLLSAFFVKSKYPKQKKEPVQ